ncbi:minor capsid protein [Streptomyces griseus]|uniref:minor capsid protein n=1 Tax=Streptomyces griseus TaxID=1911 RepID=UPI0004C7FFA7|nr:minor capsid protein [Streptomyces griseus]
MTYTVDLLEGLAALMADEGLGVYRPDAPIRPGETPIILGAMPEEPARVYVLTPYPVEDTDTTDAITAVQIRYRAGPDLREVWGLADGALRLLHERRSYRLRSVYVALSWRESAGLMGQDTHGRHELTSNFYFRTTRPGPFLNE